MMVKLHNGTCLKSWVTGFLRLINIENVAKSVEKTSMKQNILNGPTLSKSPLKDQHNFR